MTIDTKFIVVLFLVACEAAATWATERPAAADPIRQPAAALAGDLTPVWECLAGGRESFSIAGKVGFSRGERIEMTVRLERFDADSYDLAIDHADYALVLRRRADATALALPRHRIVHVGRGPADPNDHMAPAGLASRLLSRASQAALAAQLLDQASPMAVAGLLVGLLGVKRNPAEARWERGQQWLAIDDAGGRLRAGVGSVAVDLAVGDAGPRLAVDDFPGCRPNTVPRDEIERMLCRGIRRALEILLPGPELTSPLQDSRSVPHGTLEWMGGLRVVTLRGTPQEIGRAHGELLAVEARRCIDSVLNVVGLAETIRGGTWFRTRLDDAARRLTPHIPEHHLRETRAMAAALGLDPSLVAAVNVFPELFHCSGFAVAGAATADGTLYHGRILDYMTGIGLQDAAAAFVIVPEGRIPFVSVGYAGFTGSVTGMNARRISLGEMGGRGEGQWDGVPMATLMRRALEECDTLDEVVELWRNNPRTCEYYYVFADGNTRRSVAAAATPAHIEFITPGEAHARLGPGIRDAVILSEGDRLTCLRGRVEQAFGMIDEQAAIRLMARPVATSSNLHNVLFIPERLVLHVAHASHTKPAAECLSVRLDLAALLAAGEIGPDKNPAQN